MRKQGIQGVVESLDDTVRRRPVAAAQPPALQHHVVEEVWTSAGLAQPHAINDSVRHGGRRHALVRLPCATCHDLPQYNTKRPLQCA
jgi:hypothetical protein